MSAHSGQPRSGPHASQQRPRLGRRMARFNHAVTNKVSIHVAGWAPGMGIVIHVGRRTGTVYRTPVNVFRTKDGFRFALTYGRDAEWVRNALAHGAVRLVTHRPRVRAHRPRDRARSAPPACRPGRARLASLHAGVGVLGLQAGGQGELAPCAKEHDARQIEHDRRSAPREARRTLSGRVSDELDDVRRSNLRKRGCACHENNDVQGDGWTMRFRASRRDGR